mmetsp:Transcript_103522/g.221369  ORF Transcript_103522/g.221369 Transcript_103522/m.221369 type:complete len:310 (-) Transcript_103522:783-1712(-)
MASQLRLLVHAALQAVSEALLRLSQAVVLGLQGLQIHAEGTHGVMELPILAPLLLALSLQSRQLLVPTPIHSTLCLRGLCPLPPQGELVLEALSFCCAGLNAGFQVGLHGSLLLQSTPQVRPLCGATRNLAFSLQPSCSLLLLLLHRRLQRSLAHSQAAGEVCAMLPHMIAQLLEVRSLDFEALARLAELFLPGHRLGFPLLRHKHLPPSELFVESLLRLGEAKQSPLGLCDLCGEDPLHCVQADTVCGVAGLLLLLGVTLNVLLRHPKQRRLRNRLTLPQLLQLQLGTLCLSEPLPQRTSLTPKLLRT